MRREVTFAHTRKKSPHGSRLKTWTVNREVSVAQTLYWPYTRPIQEKKCRKSAEKKCSSPTVGAFFDCAELLYKSKAHRIVPYFYIKMQMLLSNNRILACVDLNFPTTSIDLSIIYHQSILLTLPTYRLHQSTCNSLKYNFQKLE